MLDYGVILAVRQRQRVDPTAYLAPPSSFPDWPTPPQTGTMALWGDNAVANLAGGTAMVMWDWPSRTVEEAYTWPEALPELP